VFQAAASPYSAGTRRSLSSLSLPAGSMRIGYRVPASAEDPPSPEGTFRIWIHHFLPVARARRDLPGDYPLDEQAMLFAEEDISLLQSSFFLQGETPGAYKTSAPVRQGELIRGDLLQRLPAVRAGERVIISFTRPGLRVTLPGRALRSGGVGDLISVRLEATAKRLDGRITARGEVLVEGR
jgi:flagella basal body P-ring formation protein FlgA